jgi:hypothetical protein
MRFEFEYELREIELFDRSHGAITLMRREIVGDWREKKTDLRE